MHKSKRDIERKREERDKEKGVIAINRKLTFFRVSFIKGFEMF